MKCDSKTWLCSGPSPTYAIPILLVSRLLVGVCTGLGHMPGKEATVNQCIALLAIFALLCTWLAVARPFLVPAANVCEFVVAGLQCVTVLLNFAFVGDDASATFLGLTRAEALTTQKDLITAALVFLDASAMECKLFGFILGTTFAMMRFSDAAKMYGKDS